MVARFVAPSRRRAGRRRLAVAAACLFLSSLAGCWLNPWDPLGKADDVNRHHAEPMQNRQWMDVSGGPWQGLPESAGVP
jgi:hypothetical protein